MKAKKNDSIRRRLASLGGTGIFNRWQRDLCDELGFSQDTNVNACYEALTGREKYLFDKVIELKYANSGLKILFSVCIRILVLTFLPSVICISFYIYIYIYKLTKDIRLFKRVVFTFIS